MLRLLSVRNLAVIESVDVQFEPGFNVLTGETGAGKSILVDAIELLVGGRGDAALVARTSQALGAGLVPVLLVAVPAMLARVAPLLADAVRDASHEERTDHRAEGACSHGHQREWAQRKQ